MRIIIGLVLLATAGASAAQEQQSLERRFIITGPAPFIERYFLMTVPAANRFEETLPKSITLREPAARVARSQRDPSEEFGYDFAIEYAGDEFALGTAYLRWTGTPKADPEVVIEKLRQEHLLPHVEWLAKPFVDVARRKSDVEKNNVDRLDTIRRVLAEQWRKILVKRVELGSDELDDELSRQLQLRLLDNEFEIQRSTVIMKLLEEDIVKLRAEKTSVERLIKDLRAEQDRLIDSADPSKDKTSPPPTANDAKRAMEHFEQIEVDQRALVKRLDESIADLSEQMMTEARAMKVANEHRTMTEKKLANIKTVVQRRAQEDVESSLTSLAREIETYDELYLSKITALNTSPKPPRPSVQWVDPSTPASPAETSTQEPVGQKPDME